MIGSSINGYCENWIFTCQKMKFDPYLTLLTKINLKWINKLNLRPKIVKLLGKNIGKSSLTLGLAMSFRI